MARVGNFPRDQPAVVASLFKIPNDLCRNKFAAAAAARNVVEEPRIHAKFT